MYSINLKILGLQPHFLFLTIGQNNFGNKIPLCSYFLINALHVEPSISNMPDWFCTKSTISFFFLFFSYYETQPNDTLKKGLFLQLLEKMFLKPVWECKMHGVKKIGIFRPLFCVGMLGKSTNYSTRTLPL